MIGKVFIPGETVQQIGSPSLAHYCHNSDYEMAKIKRYLGVTGVLSATT